jgi:hypothetical protein
MVLTAWVQCHGRHRMHVRFCNVLDDNGDVKVPCTDCLVIRSSNKSTIFINKSDSVDGTQMLVVLLGNLASVNVILKTLSAKVYYAQRIRSYLNNLLVGHSSQEYMLLVLIWMELDDIRYLPIAKPLQTLTRLSIP